MISFHKRIKKLTCFNVFYHYFTNDRYFSNPQTFFHLVVVSDDEATISLIYYMMCLEARFYDYLASSDVKNEISIVLRNEYLNSFFCKFMSCDEILLIFMSCDIILSKKRTSCDIVLSKKRTSCDHNHMITKTSKVHLRIKCNCC